jgi:hypothetical protein
VFASGGLTALYVKGCGAIKCRRRNRVSSVAGVREGGSASDVECPHTNNSLKISRIVFNGEAKKISLVFGTDGFFFFDYIERGPSESHMQVPFTLSSIP